MRFTGNIAVRHKLITIAVLVHVGSVLFLWLGNQPATRSYPTVQVPAQVKVLPQAISGNPAQIRVPSLGIDIPVARGTYDQASATWTLSEDKAYFAAPTAPVQDKAGNVLIYGHSNWQVFAILPDIAPGAQAELVTDNGHKFLYTYESAESVDPGNVSIFSYAGPPVLTLQTCTGSWYQDRTLWRFKLTQVTEFVAPTEQQRRASVAAVIRAASAQLVPVRPGSLPSVKREQAAQINLLSAAESIVYSHNSFTSFGVNNIGQPMVGSLLPMSATDRATSPLGKLLTYRP